MLIAASMSTSGHSGGAPPPDPELGAEGTSADPKRRPKPSDLDLGGADARFGRAGVKASDFDNPLSPAIAEWLNTVGRAAKALRVYERNNTMVHQFLDRCSAQLAPILTQAPELTLTVREDRILYGRDPVLVTTDRQEGVPFILYRSGFRRLTFVQGMSREELLEFLGALSTDFASYELTGEDLVTVLWRLALPHLRYFTLDALSVSVDTATENGRKHQDDVDRLQGEIDNLVAKLYSKEVSDEDLVKGVSISREDLEALKSIRAESDEDLELLDIATARVIAAVGSDELARASSSLARDDHDTLISRLIDILVHVLHKERSSQESVKTLELLQQLFDSLLLSHRFAHATRLAKTLREREQLGKDLKEVHVSRHVLRLLSIESRIAHVLAALNDPKQSPVEVVEFLRTVGPSASSAILSMVDTLGSHAHRRMLCDLILELGKFDAAVLLEKIQRAHWSVVLDLMALAQTLDKDELAPILLWAVEHENAKVRAHAISMLRGFPPGVADELIARAILDPDFEVREAAFRHVRQRRAPAYREALDRVVRSDEIWERDERELRATMIAYAQLAGEAAVPALDKVLSPGLFARSKMTPAQVAAAIALGRIGSESAKQALLRGARTLNGKVRDACKRALAREPEPDEKDKEHDALHSLPPPPKDRPSLLDVHDPHAHDPLARARDHRPSGGAPQPLLAPAPSAARSSESPGLVRALNREPEAMPERMPGTPAPRRSEPAPAPVAPRRSEPAPAPVATRRSEPAPPALPSLPIEPPVVYAPPPPPPPKPGAAQGSWAPSLPPVMPPSRPPPAAVTPAAGSAVRPPVSAQDLAADLDLPTYTGAPLRPPPPGSTPVGSIPAAKSSPGTPVPGVETWPPAPGGPGAPGAPVNPQPPRWSAPPPSWVAPPPVAPPSNTPPPWGPPAGRPSSEWSSPALPPGALGSWEPQPAQHPPAPRPPAPSTLPPAPAKAPPIAGPEAWRSAAPPPPRIDLSGDLNPFLGSELPEAAPTVPSYAPRPPAPRPAPLPPLPSAAAPLPPLPPGLVPRGLDLPPLPPLPPLARPAPPPRPIDPSQRPLPPQTPAPRSPATGSWNPGVYSVGGSREEVPVRSMPPPPRPDDEHPLFGDDSDPSDPSPAGGR